MPFSNFIIISQKAIKIKFVYVQIVSNHHHQDARIITKIFLKIFFSYISKGKILELYLMEFYKNKGLMHLKYIYGICLAVRKLDLQIYNRMGNCNSEQIETPLQIRNIGLQQAINGSQLPPEYIEQAPKTIIVPSALNDQLLPPNTIQQAPKTIIDTNEQAPKTIIDTNQQAPKTIIQPSPLNDQLLPYNIIEQAPKTIIDTNQQAPKTIIDTNEQAPKTIIQPSPLNDQLLPTNTIQQVPKTIIDTNQQAPKTIIDTYEQAPKTIIQPSPLNDQLLPYIIIEQAPKTIIDTNQQAPKTIIDTNEQAPKTIIQPSPLNDQLLPYNIIEQAQQTIISSSSQLQSLQLLQIPKQVPQLIVSVQARAKTQLLLGKYSLCNYLSQILDGSKQNGTEGVAYTQNQATDLAKALLQGVVQLQIRQNNQQRLDVQKLFEQDNLEHIREQQLHYYGMLQKLNKKDQQIGQNIKSRVYHKIANLKKGNEIKQKWKNDYEIKCIKSNEYKLLSQGELDEVVKYEVISDHVLKMGEKIGFKIQSIKRQSNTILKVLSKVMVDYNEQINQLKYDLNLQEVMKMASISRNACEYYDNGVFLLLNYFVQSCKRLQNIGKSSKQIEKLLNDAIENISKKYPPGEGLSQENQFLIEHLKQLQVKKLGKFSHSQIPMNLHNKQAQVQDIIISYAITAEQCKDLFQELVKSTCMQKAVIFKIGLKLYPKNPNKKAMTRIKEKMFFTKDQKGQKKMAGSIRQILAKQEISYRKIIDELLEKSTAVPFKISDMVRGKCVFLQVADIIDTVKQIKDFVSKDSRFTIEEIESRFTNATPISDVTLKIVICNKIVAELQLTIQTNAAAYNFAHKIYQLQRTKVFSKLKIVHNYFQESNDDFGQLACKALKLLNSKSVLSKDISGNIERYFKLDSAKDKTFVQILPIVLQQRKALLPLLATVIDPLLQDLMLSIFAMVTGVWYKQLGKLINRALKNQGLSPKLKSVLISSFLDILQLPKESEYMQQLGFQQYQLENKKFMEEYIEEYFSIENVFKYVSENQRVFHRAQQLKQIQFWKDNQIAAIKLRDTQFVVNLVIEQHCLQNIRRLKQIFDFYFATRSEYYQIYSQFAYYYNWIDAQLTQNKSFDQEGILRSEIAIIKAQQLIENKELKQAVNILESAKLIFQKKQKQDKVIYCDVLLAECSIKENKQTLQKSIDKHTEIIKKAVTLGLQLKGTLYADALWRISEYFWELRNRQYVSKNKVLLESFTKMAIRQMSRCKGKQFIDALKEKWSLFKKIGLKQCQILQNEKLIYIKLQRLGSAGCQYLTLAKWKNLKRLNLSENQIGEKGCQHLIKGKWDNLTHLSLYQNDIGSEGCKYLSRHQWLNLSELILFKNNIGAEGCKNLSSGKWNNLTQLNLSANKIDAEGCKNLSSAKWDNLTQLDLSYNNIGNEGCQHLSLAKWNNLTQLNLCCAYIGTKGCKGLSISKWENLAKLDLQGNNIGPQGCKSLCSAKWENLTQVCLLRNHIGSQGCKSLSIAKWEKLTQLFLGENKIDAEGCKSLSIAKWENLTLLSLGRNNVGVEGCKSLSSAKWENLKQLDLSDNKIGSEGCRHLSMGKWDNLTHLNLANNKIEWIHKEQIIAFYIKKFPKLPRNWQKIS